MTVFLVDGDQVRSDPKNGQIIIQKMKTQGWWASNTAHIIFKDVKVSKDNIIGEINVGWMTIMQNFNAERFAMAIQSNGYAHVCLNEAISYAKQRKTFNKKLIKHQVIRHKIVNMIRKIQYTHALIERTAHIFNLVTNKKYANKTQKKDDMKYLSAMVAMTKVESTQTLEFCAREASQILGGRSYLRGGRGRKVERIYREVRVMAIGGGSEEILIDFVARQAKL
mmetsp:Transcript_142/g.193  ORF Transcript_142/g.193 Transcript_142/m.193 type:complete len:224 (-) Transcript_142:13-684(-)